MKILDSSATIVQIVKIQYPGIESVTRLQTMFDELIEVRAKWKLLSWEKHWFGDYNPQNSAFSFDKNLITHKKNTMHQNSNKETRR